MEILYLEDDVILSETITEFLEDNGFLVTSVYDSKTALDKLYNNTYDIFILDINLPDINGFDLVKDLREADINIPIIYTTTLNDINSLEKGYSLGADDYLRKPFELKELLFRINALIKRNLNTKDNIVKLPNNITFNLKTNILIQNNQEIFIRKKELELLKLLIKNKNRITTLDEIYQTLWSAQEGISNTSLRVYINTLRKLIGTNYIINIKKQGYKLELPS